MKSNAVIPPQAISIEEFHQIKAEARAVLIRWMDACQDRLLGAPFDREAALRAAKLDWEEAHGPE